jgi:RNA polymerase sigma factor (sigma-70 family)
VAEALRRHIDDSTPRDLPLEAKAELYREQLVADCRAAIEVLNRCGKFENGDRQRLESAECEQLARAIIPYLMLSECRDERAIGTIATNFDRYFAMLQELRHGTEDGERLWQAWWDGWWLKVLTRGTRFWNLSDIEAQDLAALVNLKFVDSLDGYRFQSSPTTFLFGVFDNDVRHYLRAKRRRAQLEIDHGRKPAGEDDDEDEWPVDESQSVEAEVIRRLFWQALEACKARLSEDKRRAFELEVSRNCRCNEVTGGYGKRVDKTCARRHPSLSESKRHRYVLFQLSVARIPSVQGTTNVETQR